MGAISRMRGSGHAGMVTLSWLSTTCSREENQISPTCGTIRVLNLFFTILMSPSISVTWITVFHFASPASPVDYSVHGIETLKVGLLGTMHALEVAQKYGAKFLVSSTSECYGDPLEHPQRETYWGNVNPIGPRSVYDEAKRFTEALTMAFHRYHKVDSALSAFSIRTGLACRSTMAGSSPTS